MSRHNRERRKLWKLGLTRRQRGTKLTGPDLAIAIRNRLATIARESQRRKRDNNSGVFFVEGKVAAAVHAHHQSRGR